MKIILLLTTICLFVSAESPASKNRTSVVCTCTAFPNSNSAWTATASNQLLTASALCGGVNMTGLYCIDASIPAGDSLKIVTLDYIVAHTSADGLGGGLSCPTKATFLSQF